jgi:hypothetical protein
MITFRAVSNPAPRSNPASALTTFSFLRTRAATALTTPGSGSTIPPLTPPPSTASKASHLASTETGKPASRAHRSEYALDETPGTALYRKTTRSSSAPFTLFLSFSLSSSGRCTRIVRNCVVGTLGTNAASQTSVKCVATNAIGGCLRPDTYVKNPANKPTPSQVTCKQHATSF